MRDRPESLLMLDVRLNMSSFVRVLAALVLVCVCWPAEGHAQGSIFGTVTRTDLGTPANADVAFFGFIRGTDNEIRVSSSDGAGYDQGFWYDDFQNYLDEAPGVRFDYFLFDTVALERCQLSATILAESIQQEDANLLTVAFPSAPTGLHASRETNQLVTLRWDYDTDRTYHVYRRTKPSNGSLFRLDDPAGRLTNSGVADSVFEDTTTQEGIAYDYLIVAEGNPGWYSPPSAFVTVLADVGCCLPPTVGDCDQSGLVDITDLQVLIDHEFLSLAPLVCEAEGDTDRNSVVDITDLQILIDSQFLSLTPLPACP